MREAELLTLGNATLGHRQALQVFKLGKNVDVNFKMREVGDAPPTTACTETKFLWLIGKVGPKVGQC